MTWWPWRKKIEQAQEAVRAAEELRDHAEEQRTRAEEMAPRVDAVAERLRKLRSDNHFGPMIDAILRGARE